MMVRKSGVREKMKQEIRTSIYNVAIDLFKKHGYEKTTIAGITEAAGVAKGTFFNYYQTKDALLASYYNEITLNSFEAMKSRSFETSSDAIQFLIGTMADQALQDPDLYIAMGNVRLSSTAIMTEEQALDREFRNLCRFYIDRGIQAGEFEKDTLSSSFVEILLSLVTGTAHEWRITAGKKELKRSLHDRVAYLISLISSAPDQSR
jgi:AcrR family transcriptional regulator